MWTLSADEVASPWYAGALTALAVTWTQFFAMCSGKTIEVMMHLQGWLDDRVECRNALSKLYKLETIRYMDRTEVPFMHVGERESRYWEWGKK